MVALTQRLARMQEAKLLKEQVDVAQHKEAVLKGHLQACTNEAYTITASIGAKLTQLQATQQRIQGGSSVAVVTDQCVEDFEEAAAQCTAKVATIQIDFGDPPAKTSGTIE